MTSPNKALWQELLVEVALTLLFSIAAIRMPHWIYEAIPSTVDPALMPKLTAGVAALCCIMLTYHAAVSVYNSSKGKELSAGELGDDQGNLRAVIAYIALMFSYVAALFILGFIVATPIIMLLLALMLGVRRWFLGLLCYVLFTLILYYTCFHLMQVILPSGILIQTLLG